MFTKRQSAQDAYTKGLKAEADGNLKEALRCFKIAAERAPNEIRHLEAMGRVLEAMGKMALATEWYMRAARVQMASSGESQKGPPEALDPVVEAAWVHNLKANQLDEEQAAAAIERVRALLSALGPDPVAYRKLAMLLGRVGRIGETATLFGDAHRAELRGMRWR